MTSSPCLYCDKPIRGAGWTPHKDNAPAWAKEARKHREGCDWVKARGTL